MAGIGEASAIIGVVQFGFSLATQLKNYYDDFHDAGEDITNLANSLTSVCSNAQELQKLIDKDVIEHGFTPHASLDAQTCCVQTQKLADKLWKMVCKPNKGEFPKGRMVVKDDIEFNKFRFQWPLWKPQVEKHKAELNYLDLKIMMVKKDYRVPGLSNEERERVARDMDSLKRAKRRALEDLKEIKAKQKQRKKKKVQISEEPPGHRSRTPSSAASFRRGSVGSFHPSRVDVDADAGDDRDNYEDPGYDADYDGAGGGLSASILGEIVDRMAPRLREDILAEIEEEKQLQVRSDANRKKEKADAIEEYRHSLVEQWKKTQQDADEMRQQLKAAFRDDGLAEEKIAQFVKQRQVALVQGNEMAQILNELGVKVPTADMGKSEDGDGTGIKGRQYRRRGVFSFLFRRSPSSQTGSRSISRDQFSGDETPAFDVSDQSTVSRTQGRWIFSVVVTVDGDLRRVSRVNLPSPWVNVILAEQDKRRWWKSASFKKTMRTYARLDLTSRNLAEMHLEDEGVSPNDLVLLYARQLDYGISKRRKILESTLLSAHPWEYFHGRVLLVYVVQNEGGGNESLKNNGPGSRDPGGSGQGLPYQESESSEQPKLMQRSHFLPGPGSNFDYLGGSGEYHGDGNPVDNEAYRRVEDTWHEAPKYSSSHSRDSSKPSREYERIRSRSSTGAIRLGSYDEPKIRFHGDSKGQIWDHRSGAPPWSGSGLRPVFPKMHRKFIEPETLAYYDLPWEFDKDDGNYIIIERDLDQYEIEVLFEHTRFLRRYNPDRLYNTRDRHSYDDYESSSAPSPIQLRSHSDGKLANYDNYYSSHSHDASRSHSRSGEKRRSYNEPSYHHEPEQAHIEYERNRNFYRDVSRHKDPVPVYDFIRSGEGFTSNSRPDTHLRGSQLSSGGARQHREELVEQLADIVVRERTRPGFRSRGSGMDNANRRLIEQENTVRNRRLSSNSQVGREERANMEEQHKQLREEKRAPERSRPSRADSLRSRSHSRVSVASERSDYIRPEAKRRPTPPPPNDFIRAISPVSGGAPSFRSTFEYPSIDAIVEHGLRSARPDRSRSRGAVSPTLRRRTERIGSQEGYLAKGILKTGSDRQGSGDSSRRREDAAVAENRKTDRGDDTGSDLFSSEMDDSDADSSEPMSRPQISSSSTEGSLLDLDRKLTDSPTSYSNSASDDDYDDYSDIRHGIGIEGVLSESVAVVTAPTYLSPYAESYAESEVNRNGHSRNVPFADGNDYLIDERQSSEHGDGEGPVCADTDDEGVYHSAPEDRPVLRPAIQGDGTAVYPGGGDLREHRDESGEEEEYRDGNEEWERGDREVDVGEGRDFAPDQSHVERRADA